MAKMVKANYRLMWDIESLEAKDTRIVHIQLQALHWELYKVMRKRMQSGRPKYALLDTILEEANNLHCKKPQSTTRIILLSEQKL